MSIRIEPNESKVESNARIFDPRYEIGLRIKYAQVNEYTQWGNRLGVN